jgi:DNA-binding response OmpR family regulator
VVQKRILIVEDEPSLRSILGAEFSKAGFGICVAGDATTAFRIAKESEPDLILLDILLPNGDGTTLLKQFKTDQKTKHIPVVVLTNLSAEETRKQCEAAGVDEFLVKADCSISQLVDKVKSVLERIPSKK